MEQGTMTVLKQKDSTFAGRKVESFSPTQAAIQLARVPRRRS